MAIQVKDDLIIGLSLRLVYCKGISQLERELICTLDKRLFARNIMTLRIICKLIAILSCLRFAIPVIRTGTHYRCPFVKANSKGIAIKRLNGSKITICIISLAIDLAVLGQHNTCSNFEGKYTVILRWNNYLFYLFITW